MSMMLDPNASLFDNIRQTGGLWFGVIDGAQVDDVVAALSQTVLQSQPLYIGLENKPEQLKTAPFLVVLNGEGAASDSLPDEGLIRQFFDVAQVPSACVFWHCNGGSEVMYHHLRSLNKIIIPQTNDGVVSETATEAVLFRHADANVMTQVLPALNLAELSRLLGPADLILVRPSNEWGGGILYATHNLDMPQPDNGFLQLSPQTYQQIILNRHQGFVNKIEMFLSKITAHSKPAPQELKRIAKASYVEAYRNGIKTQAGFYSWAYFYYAFGSSFVNEPEMQEYFATNREASKDELLKAMFYQNIDNLKNMGA